MQSCTIEAGKADREYAPERISRAGKGLGVCRTGEKLGLFCLELMVS
jgi:hypothetical protein